jgi:ABC-2 type transport system permease protein
MSQEPGVLHNGWDKLVRSHSSNIVDATLELIRKTLVVAEQEVRKLRHDPSELLTRAAQPVLWLLIFGQVFTRVRAIPTGNLRYLDFMAPGILAQSVLFVAIFGGMTIIWERDLGVIHKFLASPTPRVALVLGKALAAGVRSLSQVVLIYILALLLGVEINLNPLSILGIVLIVLLGAACFSLFSIGIACLVKTRERMMGIGQLMTMPLFFASNAIYPISLMPKWLQVISHINPLTYEVDALRGLMLVKGTSIYGFGLDVTVLLLAVTVLAIVSGRLYPRIVM